MHKQEINIAVIGAHKITKKDEALAIEVGKIVAKVGAILICGGLGGAMEAACKGAKQAGGRTIGILPGTEKRDANPFVDIALPTSIGYSRNVIIVCSADIIIALPGSHGTNSEICYGLIYNRPVIDFGNWGIDGMIPVKNVKEAEDVINECIRNIRSS